MLAVECPVFRLLFHIDFWIFVLNVWKSVGVFYDAWSNIREYQWVHNFCCKPSSKNWLSNVTRWLFKSWFWDWSDLWTSHVNLSDWMMFGSERLCSLCLWSDARSLSDEQVNNATARVMTNKKMVSPYANGEGLSSLPYGKISSPQSSGIVQVLVVNWSETLLSVCLQRGGSWVLWWVRCTHQSSTQVRHKQIFRFPV